MLCGASHRGFKSHPLRQSLLVGRALRPDAERPDGPSPARTFAPFLPGMPAATRDSIRECLGIRQLRSDPLSIPAPGGEQPQKVAALTCRVVERR
jgi:hypothetical protein